MNHKHDLIIELCKNKSVLHVGATDYPFHIEKAKEKNLLHQKIYSVAKSLIGLDINKKAITDLIRFNINNIFYGDIVKDEYDIELKNKTFEVIVFADVIEHLDNPGIGLNNIKKFMESDTLLILTTPNVWSIFHILNHFRRHELVHPDHTFWPSKKTMDNLITRQGFEIKHFEYVIWGSKYDSITLKGRIFKRFVLSRYPFMAPVLFYVLTKK